MIINLLCTEKCLVIFIFYQIPPITKKITVRKRLFEGVQWKEARKKGLVIIKHRCCINLLYIECYVKDHVSKAYFIMMVWSLLRLSCWINLVFQRDFDIPYEFQGSRDCVVGGLVGLLILVD